MKYVKYTVVGLLLALMAAFSLYLMNMGMKIDLELFVGGAVVAGFLGMLMALVLLARALYRRLERRLEDYIGEMTEL